MIRKNVLLLVSLGLGAAILGAPAPADGFVTLFPRRVWDVVPAAIDINKSQLESSIRDGDFGESALLDAVNDPVNGWNGSGAIAADIVFLYTTNLAAVNGDGFPTIEFNDPINICTGGCLAATLTGFFHATAGDDTIDDADCYVDAQSRFTSENEDPSAGQCGNSEFYIEGVLQHEIGHMIGLGHSGVNGATMSAFVSPCDIGADELAQDDKNGANSLY